MNTSFRQKFNLSYPQNQYMDRQKICIQPSSFLLSRESFALGSASIIFFKYQKTSHPGLHYSLLLLRFSDNFWLQVADQANSLPQN